MSEPDVLDEVVETMLRTGLTAAGRIGDELARAREPRLHVAQAAAEQQGRELRARIDAERAAARAQVEPAQDARWWDNGKAEDIVRVHLTATAWKNQDPWHVPRQTPSGNGTATLRNRRRRLGNGCGPGSRTH